MLFAIFCTDKAASLEVRARTRPAHLAYLRRHQDRLVQAGPLLDEDGNPDGSLFILEVAERAEAEAFAAGDPYAGAGLFAEVAIRPYRQTFKDGVFQG